MVILLGIVLGARTSSLDCLNPELQPSLFRAGRVGLGMGCRGYLDTVRGIVHGGTLF